MKENKVNRKKGIRYLRCEHLIKGSQSYEVGAQWIGENTRIILCPVCENVAHGKFIRYARLYVYSLDVIDEDEENEEIANEVKDKNTLKDWYNQFISGFMKRME